MSGPSQRWPFFGGARIRCIDLDRFSQDAPEDDAPEDGSVCVVAAQPDTFRRCKAGFYPSPVSYDRSHKEFGYMAFYRTKPVSAVTHYGKVVERKRERRREEGVMNERDWQETIEPFVDEDEVVVFRLGDLVPLEKQVSNDSNGVRGAWYCTIGDLRSASTISELEDLSEA